MRPVVSQVALTYRDDFAVAKLDVNLYPNKTEEYHIRATPTFILFYKGKIVTAMVGAMTIKTLVDRIFEGLMFVIQPPLTEEQTDTE